MYKSMEFDHELIECMLCGEEMEINDEDLTKLNNNEIAKI